MKVPKYFAKKIIVDTRLFEMREYIYFKDYEDENLKDLIKILKF